MSNSGTSSPATRGWQGIVYEAIWALEHDQTRRHWAVDVLTRLGALGDYWMGQERDGDIRPDGLSSLLALEEATKSSDGLYGHPMCKTAIEKYRRQARRAGVYQ